MSGRLTHAKTHYPFKRGCSSSTEARLFSCSSLSILMYSSPWKADQRRDCQRGLCFLSAKKHWQMAEAVSRLSCLHCMHGSSSPICHQLGDQYQPNPVLSPAEEFPKPSTPFSQGKSRGEKYQVRAEEGRASQTVLLHTVEKSKIQISQLAQHLL